MAEFFGELNVSALIRAVKLMRAVNHACDHMANIGIFAPGLQKLKRQELAEENMVLFGQRVIEIYSSQSVLLSNIADFEEMLKQIAEADPNAPRLDEK